MDSYPMLVRWRRRPAPVALLLASALVSITGGLVAVEDVLVPMLDLPALVAGSDPAGSLAA